MNLINYLKSHGHYFHTNNIKLKLNEFISVHAHSIEGFEGEFIPNILKYKLRKMKTVQKVSFINNINDIVVNLYYFSNIIFSHEILYYIAKQFIYLDTFVKSFFKKKYDICRNKYVINVILDDNDKMMRINKGHLNSLTSSEVNSGYTYNLKCRDIYLYRLEEIFKVFIHEQIHANRLDWIINQNDWKIDDKFMLNKVIDNNFYDNSYINELFHLSSTNVNNFNREAISESTALLLQLIILSNRSSSNDIYEFDENIFFKFLNREIEYSTELCAKILVYYGYMTYDDFLQGNNGKFIEKTNVFAYYFLKTAIIIDYNTFMNLLLDDKRNDLYIIHTAITFLLTNNVFNFKISELMKKNSKQKLMYKNISLKMCYYSLLDYIIIKKFKKKLKIIMLSIVSSKNTPIYYKNQLVGNVNTVNKKNKSSQLIEKKGEILVNEPTMHFKSSFGSYFYTKNSEGLDFENEKLYHKNYNEQKYDDHNDYSDNENTKVVQIEKTPKIQSKKRRNKQKTKNKVDNSLYKINNDNYQQTNTVRKVKKQKRNNKEIK